MSTLVSSPILTGTGTDGRGQAIGSGRKPMATSTRCWSSCAPFTLRPSSSLPMGAEVDAVLLQCENGVLTFEGWDKGAGQPNGDVTTIKTSRVLGLRFTDDRVRSPMGAPRFFSTSGFLSPSSTICPC